MFQCSYPTCECTFDAEERTVCPNCGMDMAMWVPDLLDIYLGTAEVRSRWSERERHEHEVTPVHAMEGPDCYQSAGRGRHGKSQYTKVR